MGLSTVHGIVHEHGGHIVVETALGAGAVFRILFRPIDAAGPDPGEPLEPAQDAKPWRRLYGRVLVVDDEPAVAEFMQDMLQDWGLEVVVHHHSLEARDSFARDPQRFDLVVLDQTMPQLTGLQLAQHILAHRAAVPVILYTGYREALSEEQVRALGIRALVRKPVDVGEFFALVATFLPGAAAFRGPR